MKLDNKIMLITYPDSMGKNLTDLRTVLDKYLKGVVGGVHILPFYPSSGDRGFAPLTYEEVQSDFGNWQQVEDISKEYDMMYDFMINHISMSSEYFQDFLRNKDQSKYKDYFIRYKEFWPTGEPSQKQIDQIYKRKPRAPYFEAEFQDGTKEKVWCTFDEEQIDLDVTKEATRDFIKRMLEFLCERGAKVIRIDAFAYATKKVDSSCFFVEPDTWELLDFLQGIVEPYGVAILPEIHEHYSIQMKLAEEGFWVYDFALPMLVLHTIYSGSSKRLIEWLKICPHNQFTTLDTHDGIGVVDVADLMSLDEIEAAKQNLFSKGANVKEIYNTMKYNNLDTYQLNCTYYSALGDDDNKYLLARAIQFFSPGIPQVYYVGLLAGKNDIELLEKTKIGRNINRHNYSVEEIEQELDRPVLKKLFELMRFRNTYPAFDGEIQIEEHCPESKLLVKWSKGSYCCSLDADLKTHRFTITYMDAATGELATL